MEMLNDIFFTPFIIGGIKLPFNLFSLLLELVLPLILAVVLYKLIRFAAGKILTTLKVKEKTKETIGKWLKLILRIIYFVFIIILVARLLGAQMMEYISGFYSVLNNPLVESGSTRISVVTILLSIPIFYFASWAGKLTRGFFNQTFINRLKLDESTRFSLSSLTRYTVIALVLLFGLSIIGIDLSALTVVFGVLGIGLGFGLQNVVSNFFSGIVIIFSRPIKEGDRILVTGFEGTVVHIRLLSSVINTLAHETIIVPNSDLVNSTVHNYSYSDRHIVVKNEFEVAYQSDPDIVTEVLDELSRKCPYRLPDHDPLIRIDAFNDSGIRITVLNWIREVGDRYAAKSWINMEIWKILKEGKIEIPYPQIDLHVKDMPDSDKESKKV